MLTRTRARSWIPPRDRAVAGALTASALLLAAIAMAGRPSVIFGDRFLFGDEGHNLLVAQTLLSGGALYRDVFSQYGPVPAYIHAAFAGVLGNTPQTYLVYAVCFHCFNVPLAYALFRRASGVPIAAMATAAFVVLTVAPVSLVGGYVYAAYTPLERTALLLIALGWRAPDRRSVRRAACIGCALGLWQGIRFGGAVVAGASIVMADAACWWSAGRPANWFSGWFKTLAVTAAAFAGVEFLWVLAAFATLPPALALDVLWPQYMLNQFSYWVTPERRWIPWSGWPLMIAQYLLPLSAALAGVAGFGRWLRRNGGRSGDDAAVFIPLCFFALGCFGYFRMVHHFRQFMWTLIPAAAWELERRGVTVRAVCAAVWSPGIAVAVKSALVPATVGALTMVALPSGGVLYVNPAIAERLQFLQQFTSTEAQGKPVLFIGAGSGWHYAYHVPYATRHTWVWAPEILRPYEERDFIAALDRTAAYIECDGADLPGSPPLPFPPAVADAVRSRLTPWIERAGCRVYHLRQPF